MRLGRDAHVAKGAGHVVCGGAKVSSAGRGCSRFNLRRPLRVGAWNVLSLRDDDRLPLLSSELSRLDISIAALSEVRRPGSGEISEGDFTFYWSGRSDGHHTQGVAVAISNRLAQMVVGVTPVNERILMVRIRHSLGVISVLSVYAPTDVSDPSVSDGFYDDLVSAIGRCPSRDTLLVLGDFNATTGIDRDGYEACLGPHGSGARSQNGSRLLDFAKGHGLRIAGSWFQRSLPRRQSWYSNTGVVAKEIDHVLVGGRWRLLQNCRVFRSAQFFNTDHRLVVATLRLQLKSKRLPPSQPRLDVDRLKDPAVAGTFADKLSVRLGGPSGAGDPESLWGTFKTATLEVAKGCIGARRGAKKGFVSAGTLEIIGRARSARLDGKRDLSRALTRDVVHSLRTDKEAQVRGLCEVTENHLWSSNPRPAYRAIRELRSSKPAPQCATIKAEDGVLLTEESAVRARWAEYFEQLFKANPPAVGLDTVGAVAPVANPPISCDPPTLTEVKAAIRQLKGGKAAGCCGIHAELLKAGGDVAHESLLAVLNSSWNTGVIPSDWKKGIVVPLWKGKGDRQDCNNYRGVTLLSVPGKVFARVILERIRHHLLEYQRPEQAGFTPKRSTTDRILGLRVLTERKREFQQGLLAAYVDLRKAFDSVNRDALWKLLSLRGLPPKLIDLISALYSGTESVVRCGTTVSDPFPVPTGVRQGCVLAPTLFNTCMDWVLGRMADGSGCGTSFGEVRISDLDFADDAVIFAEIVEILIEALEKLSEESEPLGLRVSWVKTKVQAFNGILGPAVQSVTVGRESVELTDRFTYLGSDISVTSCCDLEVNKRLGRAWGVMDSLNKGVWRCRYLCRRTKVAVFRTLVLPVLLYGCETWTLPIDLRRRLNSFGTKSLRRILGYHWSKKVSNQRLLTETGMRHVTCIIRERQLRLFGHVARFPEDDPVHRILSARDPIGAVRRRGRPPLSWLQQVDRHFKGMGTGRVSAWGLAKRRPEVYRRKVDAATRCLGACSHT